MAKQGEIEFLQHLGEEGVAHARNKPFSDADCGGFLAEIGALMALLPPPPARLLDLGCGTGWTSCFFARRGYHVTGQDIAEDMIRSARLNQRAAGLDATFVVSDYESLECHEEFDAAVFFDSLHHAMDERAALRSAYRALKPGGVCLVTEPGYRHARSPQSREAVAKFNVTEKDMSPTRIVRAGKQAGFRGFRVYPHARQVHVALYREPNKPWLRKLFRSRFLRTLCAIGVISVYKRLDGIVLMRK
jgi:ubiquinone/menaquinone biosynthesis C-methylase UbiE